MMFRTTLLVALLVLLLTVCNQPGQKEQFTIVEPCTPVEGSDRDPCADNGGAALQAEPPAGARASLVTSPAGLALSTAARSMPLPTLPSGGRSFRTRLDALPATLFAERAPTEAWSEAMGGWATSASSTRESTNIT